MKMPKAIVTFDLPDSCHTCPISKSSTKAYGCLCPVLMKWNEELYDKPRWCPIKELPQPDTGEHEYPYTIGYARGWNDCLYRIKEN